MKGSYILLIELKENVNIDIGKLGKIDFNKGFYVYIGSALNSLESRINRHLRSKKNIHWHIDYLLDFAVIINVFYKESLVKEECKISQFFEKKLISINGFGCSDCRCKSHLFYGDYDKIIENIGKLNTKQYHLKENT
jgi:Uri superfamily endonuclease